MGQRDYRKFRQNHRPDRLHDDRYRDDESYRTGSVIYPDAMSKKLNYTSSGDLYWPSDYQVVTKAPAFWRNL